jgi:hypothetical protein
MNKKFFEQYMHTEPLSPENKYLFLVDNQDISFAILAAGYQPTLLLPDDDAFYCLDSFLDHMDETALTGTYQIDYYYIPACSSKRINDELEQYFKRNSLKYQEGWTLFKNKEYLANVAFLMLKVTSVLKNVSILASMPIKRKMRNEQHRFRINLRKAILMSYKSSIF